jgi:hypothetical protein
MDGFQQREAVMAEAEIGDYVVEARALYVADKKKWQPVLHITRWRGVPETPVSQDFTQLPALARTETDAIQYGLTRGRAMVEGAVIGLTI